MVRSWVRVRFTSFPVMVREGLHMLLKVKAEAGYDHWDVIPLLLVKRYLHVGKRVGYFLLHKGVNNTYLTLTLVHFNLIN